MSQQDVQDVIAAVNKEWRLNKIPISTAAEMGTLFNRRSTKVKHIAAKRKL